MTRNAWALELIFDRVLHGRSPAAIPAFAPDRVRRILVIRNDNIGDVLCTTPVLRALRRAFPAAHIAALVSGHCRPVLERNPDVDEVLTYTKAKHAPRWLGAPALWNLSRMLRTVRQRRFDLAFAVRRDFNRSSAWLAYASGAPWRLGRSAPASHRFRFFLNLGQDVHMREPHEVDACLELLTAIGVLPAGRNLTLTPGPDAQAQVRRRLRAAGVDGRMALIHISNRREASRWPLASFAQAADRIHEELGLSMVVSWAPGEAENPLFPGDDGKAEEVAGQMHARSSLLPTPTLDELIAAVSLSNFVLSTDGGLMHIAAALDIPQVVIFGKTDPRAWTPVSERCVLLQRGGRADQISVDETVAAAVSVMSRWGSALSATDPRISRPW